VLSALQLEEERIDAELKRMGEMDEDDLEKLRVMRELKMKNQALKMQKWKAKGHGEYSELPTQQDFFDATKGSERVIVHFFKGNSPMCELIDKHMAILAHSHMESKFVKLNAEKSPFLTERMNIWMLPAIVMVKNQKTVHIMNGMDELGSDRFTTQQFSYYLSKFGVIEYKEARPESPCSEDECDHKKTSHKSKSSIRNASVQQFDDDDD